MNNESEGFMITGKMYDRLKFVCTILLPALATLVLTVGGLYNLDDSPKIAGVITAVAFFVGTLIGVSSKNFKASDSRLAGTVVITPSPDDDSPMVVSLELNDDPMTLTNNKELTFKVQGP